jgi:citrate synthase
MTKNTVNNSPRYKAATKICLETACIDNPYQAEKIYLSGYDIEELADKCSFVDMIFLMFTGEFSRSLEDKQLLKTLQVLLSMPSPRHPASRAAMNSGICKANEEHLLPISLMALGGTQSGALEVKECINFVNDNIEKPANQVADELVKTWTDKHLHIAPGFGQLYGSPDKLSHSFLEKLLKIKPEGKTIKWLHSFVIHLNKYDAGILDVGIAACVFHELSFGSRESVGLYQLLRAPGLLAYAMEQTHKPISAIPMLKDSEYELTKK